MPVNDATDAFDRKLELLRKSSRIPESEIDAAITTYERLRTARAIAESLLTKPSNADVLALLAELGSESRCARSAAEREWASVRTSAGDRP